MLIVKYIKLKTIILTGNHLFQEVLNSLHLRDKPWFLMEKIL